MGACFRLAGERTVRMKFYYTVDSDSIRKYMPTHVPYLLPASSWYRHGMRRPNLPEGITERAADCGGYVAAKVWGEYRYTPQQYVDWLGTFEPQWAATMDYSCETDLTGGAPSVVCDHQMRTTQMAHHFWEQYRDAPWCWTPSIQGWDVHEYQWHALRMKPLIEEMRRAYGAGSAFRVGIGTLCHRASVSLIRQIIEAVSEVLPDVQFHLWGVKLATLQSPVGLPKQVASVDSAAWNGRFGHDIANYQERSDLSQREYLYQVQLGRYQIKVEVAQTGPKQLPLFEEKQPQRPRCWRCEQEVWPFTCQERLQDGSIFHMRCWLMLQREAQAPEKEDVLSSKSRCYRIGWNMAADDLQPMERPRIDDLAMDVSMQEYPDAEPGARTFYANEFLAGYHAQFAWRDVFARRSQTSLWEFFHASDPEKEKGSDASSSPRV